MSVPLLDVRGLSIAAIRHGLVQSIVDRVSFTVDRGEILGMVGESGSGKTVTCRALMRLFPTSNLAITEGEIRLAGSDIAKAPEAELRRIRGRRIGMIFQNPSSHLDPIMSIGRQIGETLEVHKQITAREARALAVELLRQVGIPDPQQRVDNYPFEFSGGMRQRAMIALALACDPDLLIADEPTTALDVTIQAQILRLLLELRDKRGLGAILITHDLAVVAQTCDRVAVMYAGRLCESGPKRELLKAPRHPYTQKLLACQPARAAPQERTFDTIPGQPPSVSAYPEGCRFHPRCARAMAKCREDAPALVPVERRHSVACHAIAGEEAA
ncbi:MAG: ABC transporter ATP-binding protein [Parvibaculaceae bacterium]